jgi:hypothetical protein
MSFKWREFATLVGLTVGVGCIVGLFDLWIFELSFRGFLAGLAGGVGYFLVLLLVYGPLLPLRQMPRLLVAVLAVIAGSVGAVCWWLVCSGAPLWAAILVGSAMALSHFGAGGLFQRRWR